MAYLYLRDEKLFYKVYSQWSYELCLYPDLERDPLFKAVIDLIVTCVHVSYVVVKMPTINILKVCSLKMEASFVNF